MIPARIINIDDKVMVSYPIEPDYDSIHKVMGISLVEENSISRLIRDSNAYKYNTTIAEVENVIEGYNLIIIEGITYPTYLNNKCFIEPTTPGKAKIVKI